MIGKEQLHEILARGVREELYAPMSVEGRGAYSLVLKHSLREDLVVKITCCEASIRLLQQIQRAPLADFVTVYHSEPLGRLPGTQALMHLFVLERLHPLTNAELTSVHDTANLAYSLACEGAARPPRRGSAEYVAFGARYCQALARLDAPRQQGWEFLAKQVRRAADPFQSVDILTPGNLLSRQGRIVISDPLRIVSPSSA